MICTAFFFTMTIFSPSLNAFAVLAFLEVVKASSQVKKLGRPAFGIWFNSLQTQLKNSVQDFDLHDTFMYQPFINPFLHHVPFHGLVYLSSPFLLVLLFHSWHRSSVCTAPSCLCVLYRFLWKEWKENRAFQREGLGRCLQGWVRVSSSAQDHGQGTEGVTAAGALWLQQHQVVASCIYGV